MSTHLLCSDHFLRPALTRSLLFILARLISCIIVLIQAISPAEAAGPLGLKPNIPNYFFDSKGTPINLKGAYLNEYNLLSGSWDFTSLLDFLKEQDHTFTRIWGWGQSPWIYDEAGQISFSSQPYQRTGPGLALDGGLRFDLARFNQAYFDELRLRVVHAGERGIYVSVMLFEGFTTQQKVGRLNPWLGDPFHKSNNINGIDGDPNQNGEGEEFFSLAFPSLLMLEQAFIRKVVDTLNDLDNVVYEVSGNSLAASLSWQYHMIDYIKHYQWTKPNQHPVGISQFAIERIGEVLNSSADWIVVQVANLNFPLAATKKVIIIEGPAATSSKQLVPTSPVSLLQLLSDPVVSNQTPVISSNGTSPSSVKILTSPTTSSTLNTATSPAKQVVTPTITPNGGVYSGREAITLETTTPGASIYYTTDGQSPTQSSQLYTGKFVLSASTLIKTKAFLNNFEPSAEASAWFAKADPSVVGATGLVAHWRFDEGQGTTTADSSGNNHTGTLINGPLWSAGRVGKALYFDGMDDSVTVADSASLGLSSSFTFSAWINPASTFKDFRSILVKNYTYYFYANVAGYCGDGNPLGGFNDQTAKTVCQPSPLPINTWTHLAVTKNGSLLTLYRNGVAVANSNVSGTLSPTTGTLQIGASEFGEYFKGLIDEVRIYSKALSLTEIQAIYQIESVETSQTVATPVISPNGGNYNSPVLVTMQTATSGASIYYTTDGSTPTQSSTLYSGPVTLTKTAVVKARAFKSGYNTSTEASTSFTVSSSGLVAHWRFDEGQGTTTADSSGNNHTGTLINGPLWSAGRVGKALYFDGMDDSVTVADSASLGLSSSFTFSAWINPASTFKDFRSILVKNYTYYFYANVAGYCGDGNPLGGFNDQTAKTVCQPSPLPINTWTHLAVTKNGSLLTLYRNGVAVANSNVSGTLSPTTGTLQIGASEFGEYFKGLIDEVRIYSKALSLTEIQAIYQIESVETSQTVATPVISPNGGNYNSPVLVTMQTATSGASIYYTTDGSTPTQSSTLYSGPMTLTQTAVVKASAFKSGYNTNSQASASFTVTQPFNFSLANSGDKSVTAGSSVTNSINATLASGTNQAVSFSVAGLPAGVTASLSSASCSPSCFSNLTINTGPSTAAGNFTITVTASGGGITKATTFNLNVGLQTIATPAISPNGGSFTNSVSITMQTATSGASIYYTTDGSTPTQSSTLYSGPVTLTKTAVVKASAFKSGYNTNSQASASFTVSSSGLVAHWRFDEGQGTTTADSSGNNHTGTLINGPLWSAGRVGKAVYFDGMDDSVTVADSASLGLSSSFTFSAWINPASTFKDFRSILVKNYTYYFYANVAGYCGDGNPLGGFNDQTAKTVCQPSPLPINTWTHLAVTKNGSLLTLYRNGVAVANSNVSGTLSPTTGTLQIGASEFGEYFKGLIDEVRIYSKALSLTEIQAIYQIESVETSQTVATPVISPNGGNYNSPVLVTMQTATSGASIYYTTDGSTPTQSSTLYSGPVTLTKTAVVKASAFKSGYNTNSQASASFTVTQPFNFSLANSGDKSVTAGSSVTNSINATLASGTNQAVSFSVAGLPAGVTGSFSSTSCNPTCSTILNVVTTGSTPVGKFPITVISTGGGVTRTTVFTLSVTLALTGAAPSIAQSATGKTYYVGKTGSNANSCVQAQSASTPKLTIAAGLACMTGGDTLIVKSGTYTEGINNTLPSGTNSSARTTIRANTGDTVTLQPTSCVGSTGNVIYILNNSNIVIDGLVINAINCSGQGIYAHGNGSGIKIVNNEIKNARSAGNCVTIQGNQINAEVINNRIHDCGSDNLQHGVYIWNTGHVIEHNEIYNVTGYGVHLYLDAGGVSNNIVRYNYIHQTGTVAGHGIILGSGSGNVAHHNVITNNRSGGVRIAYNGAINNQVYNNTISNNGGPCVDIVYATNTVVNNNVCSLNANNTISDAGSGTTKSNNMFSMDTSLVAAPGIGAGDSSLVGPTNLQLH